MSPEAKSQLDIILGSIDKKYGKGTVMHLNDRCVVTPEDVIPTGSIQLDLALGIGGYRKGRIVEIFGGESAGKSTLAHHACANTQRQGREAAYIDQEHTLDPIYSSRIGVDLDRLIISQPDHAEQALDIVEMLVRSGDIGVIIIDSVAALIPQKELEGDMGDQVIGLQARIMSQAMRKLVGQCEKAKCTLIFINQIRYKIGGYGNPETTSGGAALAFYASQRIHISKGQAKECDDFMNLARCKIVKNKCAPPKKTAEFNIVFGKGIDRDMELFDLAIEDGTLVKSGSWIKYKDESVAQGEVKAIEWMNENPEIKAKIYSEVLALRGLE
jgi:recombination protein RecA